MSELATKSTVKAAEETYGNRGRQANEASGIGSTESILALQRSAGNQAVKSLLKKSSGRPLDIAVRKDMESKLGEDFSNVRIHDDKDAAAGAFAAKARAVTSGKDIVFGAGFYAPQTSRGKKLLAHELAHVVQQAGTRRSSSSSAEADANRAATQVESGQAAHVQAAASVGPQADPLSADELQKQIAENEARAANAGSPEEAQQLFAERQALMQQASAGGSTPENPSPAPQPAPPQAAPTPTPAKANDEKIEPFDPQAGNWFAKWLLYGKDTPIRDALTNDNNLKAAQNVAAGVAITAGTIATGGLLAEAAAGAGAGGLTAGAIGGFGGSTFSVGAKAAYAGKAPTAEEAATEIALGTLTGGVGGGAGAAATKAGLGQITSAAIGGGAGAATQTAANAAITGKAPTAKEALIEVGEGAAMGAAMGKVGSALKGSTPVAEPAPGAGSPLAPVAAEPVAAPAAAQAPVPVEPQAPVPAETAVAKPAAIPPEVSAAPPPAVEAQSPTPEPAPPEPSAGPAPPEEAVSKPETEAPPKLEPGMSTGEADEVRALKGFRDDAELLPAKAGGYDATIGGEKIINSETPTTSKDGKPILVRDVTLSAPDDAIQIKTITQLTKYGTPTKTPLPKLVRNNVRAAISKAYNQPRTQARSRTPIPGTNIYERINVEAPKKITIIVQTPGEVTPEMIEAANAELASNTRLQELPPVEVIVKQK